MKVFLTAVLSILFFIPVYVLLLFTLGPFTSSSPVAFLIIISGSIADVVATFLAMRTLSKKFQPQDITSFPLKMFSLMFAFGIADMLLNGLTTTLVLTLIIYPAVSYVVPKVYLVRSFNTSPRVSLPQPPKNGS